jgi:mRNA interferase RelE/StbE
MNWRKNLNYNIKWHDGVFKDLKKINKIIAKKIIEKVKTYLSKNPKVVGKPLKGDFKGLYRYRFGDYRIVYAINELDHTIIILKVGLRKDIYDKM